MRFFISRAAFNIPNVFYKTAQKLASLGDDSSEAAAMVLAASNNGGNSMTANSQPQDCFIPLVRDGSALSVCGVLCIGRTKAGELIKEPDFPKPVSFGGRCLRYRLSEVMAWADSKRADAVPAESPSASV